MNSYRSGLAVLTFAVLGTCLALAAPSWAADWPQWRGPNFNGTSDAKNLPEKFGPEENLLWKVTLPGPSNSTPVVSGDRIFTTAVAPGSGKLLCLCVDRKDGKVLWEKEAGIGLQSKGENNMATPSPVTDGKHVWFYFGTGDLAAFDIDGKPVWSRSITKDHGAFNIQWLYGSSPLLYKGKLYVQVLHTNRPYGAGGGRRGRGGGGGDAAPAAPAAESFLLAIDPLTGKDLWKHVRPDPAQGESKESYATPIPFEHDGRAQIILVGGDVVSGHDPENGKEFWRAGGFLNPRSAGDRRVVPSAVTGAGLVFACGPKGESVAAIRPDGAGDVTATHIAWKTRDFTSDVCVPTFYKGNLYVLDPNGKKLSCIEPATGKVKWSGDLGGGQVFRASPTAADDKIYCMNVQGDVWVVSPDEFKVLHKTSLGGPGRSARGTIAVADGCVLARVGDTLYAFGKK